MLSGKCFIRAILSFFKMPVRNNRRMHQIERVVDVQVARIDKLEKKLNGIIYAQEAG